MQQQCCDSNVKIAGIRNDSAGVTEVFPKLHGTLENDFSRLFQVILTNRNTEFSNPTAIEYDAKGGQRDCRVFYCDIGNSNQKAEYEKNHEIVRYIFPKGHSPDRFEQEDRQAAMKHINSYPRLKWSVKSPIKRFKELYGPQIARKLGLVEIELVSCSVCSVFPYNQIKKRRYDLADKSLDFL